MVAWEILLLAAVPVVAAAAGFRFEVVAYLAVASLALVTAVELDAFTDVRMTPRFAIGFVVVSTMAAVGLWTIAQYASDVYLGTSLLANQTSVMWDIIAATVVGIVAGIVFELYFRRCSPGHTLSRKTQRSIE
jgi:hypothetical protein